MNQQNVPIILLGLNKFNKSIFETMSGWLLSGLGGMLTSRALDQGGGGMLTSRTLDQGGVGKDRERSRREGREKLDSDGMEGAEV